VVTNVTLFIVSFLYAPFAPAAESLSVLLQKAIYAEETEGNLDSAIRIYEQIAADGAANRSLIAQAQFRLAVCYQKQGDRQRAIAAFSGLLKQFPGETALANQTREQLVALGQPAPETVTLRKVADFDNQWFRAVSPDSRLIAFMGPDGEMLMQEPAAARTWHLFKCNWDTQPWGLVFSPDSKRVAYDTVGRLSLLPMSTDPMSGQSTKRRTATGFSRGPGLRPPDRYLRFAKNRAKAQPCSSRSTRHPEHRNSSIAWFLLPAAIVFLHSTGDLLPSSTVRVCP
jgi:hypothetical protein